MTATPRTNAIELLINQEVAIWAHARELERENIKLKQQLEEFQTLGTIEIMIRNPNVAESISHWEGRALKAEQRELELLAAIEKAACICESLGMATNGMYERNHECAVAIRKYAMSIDSTALTELLQKTRNEALASCAEWAENYDLGTPEGHGIAKFIRNMLTGKDE